MKIDAVLLKKTQEYRLKKGITVMDERSKTYIGFKLAATLSFIWAAITSILFIMGFSIQYCVGNPRADWQTPTVVGIVTAVMIVGYVFSICSNHYVGMPAVIISNLASFFLFLRLQTNVEGTYEIGLRESFYYRHAIPLILLTICIIALAYIGIRAERLLKKDCRAVLEKMYITFKEKTPEFSEELWHKYLEGEGISPAAVEKL